MDRDKAKELIRTAPTIEATFADIDAEFQAAAKHFGALKQRRDGLLAKLTAIAVAREEFESPSSATKPTGEPAPESTPADKPKKGRTR